MIKNPNQIKSEWLATYEKSSEFSGRIMGQQNDNFLNEYFELI